MAFTFIVFPAIATHSVGGLGSFVSVLLAGGLIFFIVRRKASRTTKTRQPRDHSVPRHRQPRSGAAPTSRTPTGIRAQPKKIAGRAHVIDGDTIVVKKTKVRLAGIDAPELDQPYGLKSKWALVDICKGAVVTVHLHGEKSYDREVGTAYLPDGRDIGAELIRRGLALDWAEFSKGKYRHLEPAGVRRKMLYIRHQIKSKQ